MATPRKPPEQHLPAGRPAHKPSARNRRRVVELASVNFTQEDIARHLDIEVATLVKHYGAELRDAHMNKIAMGVGKFWSAVQRGERWAIAMMFNTQLRKQGWNPTTATEISGPDGGAIPIHIETLSDAQLDKFIERFSKRRTAATGR